MQRAAGVQNPSVEYAVYTLEKHDIDAINTIAEIRTLYPNKPIVAWQSNWKERAYQTTPEQYEQHIGGPHRDIPRIINALKNDCVLLEAGLPDGITQHDGRAANSETFSQTASLLKFCDWFIGAEGGLSNLAAGVGTRCIITTCFIQQVYGRLGHVKQIEHPQMGPAVYFPNAGHIHLEPFITDDEVIEQIRTNIDYKLYDTQTTHF